jgi:LysM repeat protein
LIVLVMAVSASVAFALTRGGLVLEGAGPSPSLVAVLPSPTSLPVEPTPVITPVPPSVAPTASSSPSATPSSTPSATPTPKPAATPTSDRYKLLKACPNTPKCWIYTVRSGDNLYSIAHYFGVSQDSIYARNPWLKQSGLRAGQQLRLPPPTR